MTIGEYIKLTDINTYYKLLKMCSKAIDKPKIELGCSVEELMRADSYTRQGRRIKQRRWG
ncbi:hypothetical protein [Paratissierella segnis]|uniref:Uncharacterized protein n=1 Tax=Paratissierella segnis TaxID=2763679 RepID=A0A926ET79_9FIRM|nr:hypothetical protein [Paratissierella segnis]MBC8588080.1 hypothetical protein [Paratissierella segnis]